ncbi:AMSH-like ubiquitin thioesterase 2 isoform X2 [Eucalyptus grandis]|uniref:AMSH-like ubiquitin thioesterase 2 isoform X2 n=1 Tax=Eucalyptus grandis TaxID=71139 RepID=UPI00192EB59C|nr:AMSH-like ubiquitin thioesterase 2 isoform X2 [Eucalyptus grandis]
MLLDCLLDSPLCSCLELLSLSFLQTAPNMVNMDLTYQRETAYKCQHVHVHSVTQSFPSRALSFVEDSTQERHLLRVKGADCEIAHSSSRKNLHISARLMEEFLELAKENTDKDLETCGILGAFLDKGILYVTTLIIPKQESTSNSTHPSQSCFMSSVDLHTQYSYQVMEPEAFAIVMAPTDASRNYGIFRLSEPGGMNVLRECRETGFHTHGETADGGPIYEHCANVYTNSNLRFEVFDLRQ